MSVSGKGVVAWMPDPLLLARHYCQVTFSKMHLHYVTPEMFPTAWLKKNQQVCLVGNAVFQLAQPTGENENRNNNLHKEIPYDILLN